MSLASEIVEFKPDWYKSATAEEQAGFRKWLLELLNTREVVVTFKKKSGEERVMRCIANPPSEQEQKPPKPNDSTCTVWDLVMNQWRSFKFESITSVDFKLERN